MVNFLWVSLTLFFRGVTSISYSSKSSSVYSAGADGMVCKIDCMTGNMLEKFKASSKAISSLAVSPGIHYTVYIFYTFKITGDDITLTNLFSD